MHKILIIDDEHSIRKTLELHLKSPDRLVQSASDLATGGAVWESFKPDIVLLDLMLPDGDGLIFLQETVKRKLGGLVIMITANQDLERATEAMRIGAYDYLLKPLDIDQLDVVLNRAAHSTRIKPESAYVITDDDRYVPGRIAGQSKAVLDLYKQIGLASRCYANVLITGETGVGKEMVAKAIHRNSSYDGPFMPVNCSAIVATLTESELFGHEKGAFTSATSTKIGQLEVARDGTVFLDEIGDLKLDLQVKLLRVLQEREFYRVGSTKPIPLQARVLAATHRNLEEMVKNNEFRKDLYYRLNVLELKVPPLRQRKEDIPLLVKSLIKKINVETRRNVVSVSEKTMKSLQDYDWPGNVRELEHRLTAAIIHSPGEALEMIPPTREIASREPDEYNWKRPLEEVEKIHIHQVLQNVGGHLGKACDILGISRPTLRKKIADYDLKVSFNDS